MAQISDIIPKLQSVIDEGAAQLTQRRIVFELVILGVLTREHVVLIGPPGTGKSAAVRAVANHLSGTHFEYLLGRFTEPSELFGALDIEALRNGRVEAVTKGMLPEANTVFLDEIFLGSTAILNTLLGVLNERVYRRGAQSIDVPLWSCVAASNALPEDPMLAAFADRFLVTAFVDPVGPDHIPALLRSGWAMAQHAPSAPAQILTQADIDALTQAVLDVDLDPIIEAYTNIIAKLAVRGVVLTDRRVVRAQKLFAAAAVLAGRDVASTADLWPIVYLVQDRTLQAQVKELLAEELKLGENKVLSDAVKTAAYGPAAYAVDLVADAQKHLDSKPKLADDPGYEAWLIRAEGILARIDAGFDDETRTEALTVMRSALRAMIE